MASDDTHDEMYEGVHARPDGDSTVARMAATAADMGYAGIVVRNHGGHLPEYDPERISEEYDVDVVEGVEVRAENASRASGFVGNHRSSKTIVTVHGGDLNRFAVEQAAVDVLTHPMQGGDFNHVLAKEAKHNGVRIEFNLGQVLRADGGPRVQAIGDLRKLREIVEQYDTPYVVSADARSHLQLRAPRELRAVGEAIGFSAEQVEEGLREWGRLAKRNRERQRESYIEPGVKKGRYEE